MAEEEQQHKEQPIIIKKKGGHGDHPHHGGAWKVAYADFVTAMMAFFIVMWILASSEETKKAVSAYFEDPGAFSFITGKSTSPVNLNINIQKKGPGKGKGKGKGEGKGGGGFFDFTEEMADSVASKLIQRAMNDSALAAEKVKSLGDKFEKYWDKLKTQKPDLQHLLNSITIEFSDEGLRIELIESEENMFFQIGSAKLKKNAIDLLKNLAYEIGKLPNHVEIEGHTDSRGYGKGSSFTNWDLSTQRANAARKVMMDGDLLWPGQVTKVTGFADRKLRNKDNPFDVTNRRVSILVKQINSEKFLEIAGENEK